MHDFVPMTWYKIGPPWRQQQKRANRFISIHFRDIISNETSLIWFSKIWFLTLSTKLKSSKEIEKLNIQVKSTWHWNESLFLQFCKGCFQVCKNLLKTLCHDWGNYENKTSLSPCLPKIKWIFNAKNIHKCFK